jgi:hypothetical protein
VKDTGRAEHQGEHPEPDPMTTAARLVVGATSLGFDALSARIRAWSLETSPAPAPPSSPQPAEAGSVADAVVGVAARSVRTAASMGARGAEIVTRWVQTAQDATDTVGKLVPDFLNEPIDRARERTQQRIRRLGVVGREELNRSRAIARAALNDGLDAVISRLADNRELRFVIRAQSTSAAEEAIDGLRGEAARVDDRLEGAARRLLRRRPRPPAATAQ